MNKKLLRGLKLSLIGVLSLSMCLPVYAKTKDEAESSIRQLEQEKKSLEEKLADLKANKTTTENYITELDNQLGEISSDIESINEAIESCEAEIAETSVKLEEAKKKEEVQYEVLKKRIKAMYENGETNYLEVILQSGDMSSLLNSAEYISKVSEFDNQLLESFMSTKQAIADYEAQLNDKKSEMEASKTELEGKQEEINQVTEAKKEELLGLSGTIDLTEGDISDVEEDLAAENEILAGLVAAEQQAAAEYEKIKQQAANNNNSQAQADAQDAASKAESDKQAAQDAQNAADQAQQAADEAARVEAEKKAAQEQAEAEEAARLEEERKAAEAAKIEAQKKAEEAAKQAEEAKKKAEEAAKEAEQKKEEANKGSGSGTTAGSGSFMWPLPGYTKISSPFGTRICPFHGPETHYGVDIPAPGGTAIKAADSGVVVAATYHSSLGNYIIINHGNGYSTYYLHTSAMYVSVGTNVSKGQTIAAVGTTGSSTGNHLDFRIKTSSGYINPLSMVTPG